MEASLPRRNNALLAFFGFAGDVGRDPIMRVDLPDLGRDPEQHTRDSNPGLVMTFVVASPGGIWGRSIARIIARPRPACQPPAEVLENHNRTS